MRGKQKPAAQERKWASGAVLAGERDTRHITPEAANGQARVEREVYDGRLHLGTVRETAEGAFVAVVGEYVVGRFDTIAEATNKVLELGRGTP